MEDSLLTLKKHPIEIILILSSIIITIVIYFLYSDNNKQASQENILSTQDKKENSEIQNKSSFTVDVSGAVTKPNVYTISSDATVHDIIQMAGGFSKEADLDFIGRNFNMAKGIIDKEKIYIPSKEDIDNGIFLEETHSITSLESTQTSPETSSDITQNSNGISVNNASVEELDSLPGIGPVTAQKIIDNRPYSAVDEILSKKAVNSTTFDKIKELVIL